MKFNGQIYHDKIIRMKDMKLQDFQSEECEIARTIVFDIGDEVLYQTKAITDDQIVAKDGKTMKSVLLFVKFRSRYEKKNSVIVTSNSLKLTRFFVIQPASETKVNWHLIYNEIVAIKEWSFDLEIRVMKEGVDVRQIRHIACALLNDDVTTDVELAGTDGMVRAHGCILAAVSPFMRAAFYGNWKAKDMRLVVPDADVAKLTLIKKYAYTGYVEAEPVMLAALLPLASRFLLTDLARACAVSIGVMPADDLIPLLQVDSKLPMYSTPEENEKIANGNNNMAMDYLGDFTKGRY